MLSERIQSKIMRILNHRYLGLKPTQEKTLPAPHAQQKYMLYAHVPFCEQLCPYCSFNRYPYSPKRALPYFANLRKEMHMLKDMGYDFSSLTIGGGTPTIEIDELCRTIDLARELFALKEVTTETNPNHLIPQIIDKLQGRVQRLSVGVQSFNDDLLKQMQRYDKYGSGMQTLERIIEVKDSFTSLNVDMIFNFPGQSEDMLINDLACILESCASQVTFYPLMASPSVARSLARTLGHVDYSREERYYQMICEALTGSGAKHSGKDDGKTKSKAGGKAGGKVGGSGDMSPYTFGNAWAFNARDKDAANLMIDEYIIDFEEYPAIGSGGLSYLDGSLYVNTFSVKDYNQRIESGNMSIMGKTPFNKWDRMRYRFMMQLFGLRLDKKQWQHDFGCTVARGLPAEYSFFKAVGAFEHEDDEQILLSAKGRYLLVALMREFFIGVNNVRDQARASLDTEERELLFGNIQTPLDAPNRDAEGALLNTFAGL